MGYVVAVLVALLVGFAMGFALFKRSERWRPGCGLALTGWHCPSSHAVRRAASPALAKE